MASNPPDSLPPEHPVPGIPQEVPPIDEPVEAPVPTDIPNPV